MKWREQLEVLYDSKWKEMGDALQAASSYRLTTVKPACSFFLLCMQRRDNGQPDDGRLHRPLGLDCIREKEGVNIKEKD